jgi:hypothetical protein
VNLHDLTLLGTGINIGICLMFIAQLLRDHAEDQRDQKVLDAALAKINADREGAGQ